MAKAYRAINFRFLPHSIAESNAALILLTTHHHIRCQPLSAANHYPLPTTIRCQTLSAAHFWKKIFRASREGKGKGKGKKEKE